MFQSEDIAFIAMFTNLSVNVLTTCCFCMRTYDCVWNRLTIFDIDNESKTLSSARFRHAFWHKCTNPDAKTARF